MTENFLSLPFMQQSMQVKNIAIYIPHENEIDTINLINYFSDSNINIFLPVMIDRTLQFFSYKKVDSLQEVKFGIKEPVVSESNYIALENIDVMCIPVVAFDNSCHRLGRGGGFYDKALSNILGSIKKCPALIGLAYEFQCVHNIDADPWDVAMDYVVTEKKIYKNLR